MNLDKDQVQELNTLLKSKDIELPDFRREVKVNGGNFEWLQKHITKKNPEVPLRLRELLRIA